MKDNKKYNKKSVDGFMLYTSISAGINNLLDYQDKLDEINVFPVPDGDTGTNMCFTLLPIIEESKHKIRKHAGKVFDIMADCALESARGNSGTIIAQFFHGMRKISLQKEDLNINDFAQALKHGYLSARESLLNTREGTIITVMRAVADKATEISLDESITYQDFLEKCYDVAEESLQSTKLTLEILKKTNVVDAGALGFVLIIQGVLNSMQKDTQIQSKHLNISYEHAKIDALKKDIDFKITNKFCTECAITGYDINRDELKETIKHLGDSMVVAGTKSRVKVHIHTNDPAKFFQICSAYGKVIDDKVDDMTKQEHSIHHVGSSGIAIVVDSGADIPKEYSNDIHVVPVRYSFGRQQHIDKVTQSTSEFYKQMKQDVNHPKTSQPTPGDFKKTYNFISSHYSSIISIHLSEKVSGTYQSAINASKKIKNKKINIIDSFSASVGLGLLAVYALKLKQSGTSYSDIIDLILKKRMKTQVFLVLDDLNYIVRGGRLPAKIKTIANILRLRPVIGTKNGKLRARGVLYGKAKMVEKFANFLKQKIKENKQYVVMIAHANSKESGHDLDKYLKQNHHNIIKSYVLELGGALGAHSGPGALAVGIQEVD